MDELNKKLAEWAGFKLEEYTTTGLVMHLKRWVYPDSKKYEWLPSFTESLDACFKWLVPKLPAGCLLWYGHNKGFGAVINFPHQEVDNDNPALALCLAIEKLIDGVKKGG